MCICIYIFCVPSNHYIPSFFFFLVQSISLKVFIFLSFSFLNIQTYILCNRNFFPLSYLRQEELLLFFFFSFDFASNNLRNDLLVYMLLLFIFGRLGARLVLLKSVPSYILDYVGAAEKGHKY